MSRTWPFLLLCLLWGCEAFTANQMIYPGQQEFFELSIIHINDFHARFTQTNPSSGVCHAGDEANCVGGLPRLVTAIRQLLEEQTNPIFLNAGDNYQGTLWYNVHKWNATVHFLNKLPHDAMTIGNHDFDDRVAGLVPFLERFTAPVVVTNIDISEEPTLEGFFKNSTLIKRGNQTIGVIGVILKTTDTISNTDNLKFLDEVETVNAEAARLKAQGVNIIIVLSHCGINVDRTIAASCPDIDVIVGGHSHTFLYSGKPPGTDIPADEYPVVVKQENINRTVLIVQAAAFTKYLGNLTVWFDQQGEVVDWQGNPLLLDSSIEQDAATLEELRPWEEVVSAIGNNVVAKTLSYLTNECRTGECNLANLITDSMVNSQRGKAENSSHWTHAAISCMNAGGIRSSVEIGNVTYGDVITVMPFENSVDIVELKGSDLLLALEETVVSSKETDHFIGTGGFLHWSGIEVVYNISKPAYSRVVSARVRCQECAEPRFEEFQPDYWYRILVVSFILKGGDGLRVIADNHRNYQKGGPDVDIFIEYLKSITPFDYKTDGRMQVLGEWQSLQLTRSDALAITQNMSALLPTFTVFLSILLSYF